MVIASKDEEIESYRRNIDELRKHAAASQIDADKQTIVLLRDQLKEKDDQVMSLEKQLQEVSSEMKEITDQIENIKMQADKGEVTNDVFLVFFQDMKFRLISSDWHLPGLPSAFQQKQINELHTTLNREKLTAVVERNRVKLAENTMAEKDKEVNELMAKLMQYERGK